MACIKCHSFAGFCPAGRLIRHQKDYGCVLLLDHRYNVLKFRQLTPAWLQPLLKSTAMADAPALLQNFFAGRC